MGVRLYGLREGLLFLAFVVALAITIQAKAEGEAEDFGRDSPPA